MCRVFIGRLLASIVALLIAGSVFLTHGQSQSSLISDADEADILESLIQSQFKAPGSEIGNIRIFSSDKISSTSAKRIAKHGLALMTGSEIRIFRQAHVVDYVVIRSIYLNEGVVVVRLSTVTEGRPCFAPPFSQQHSFTYEFKKDPFVWTGKLIKPPVQFFFDEKLGSAP